VLIALLLVFSITVGPSWRKIKSTTLEIFHRGLSQKENVEGHRNARNRHGNVKSGADDGKLVEDTRETFPLRQKHGFESWNSPEICASANEQQGKSQQPVEGINVHFFF